MSHVAYVAYMLGTLMPRQNGWTDHEPVWGQTRVGPRNHDGVQITLRQGALLRGMRWPIVEKGSCKSVCLLPNYFGSLYFIHATGQSRITDFAFVSRQTSDMLIGILRWTGFEIKWLSGESSTWENIHWQAVFNQMIHATLYTGPMSRLVQTFQSRKATKKANGIRGVYRPTVVRRDVAKKKDCPKLQFGTLETLCDAEMPALLASITASTNSSRSSPVQAINLPVGLIYTVSQKKQDTKLLTITSPTIIRFSKFFH